MYIYIGAVSFNVETTLYFLKFNNLFVFFSCFCLRPANRLVNVVSVLQRLENRPRLQTDGERASYIFNIFCALDPSRLKCWENYKTYSYFVCF